MSCWTDGVKAGGCMGWCVGVQRAYAFQYSTHAHALTQLPMSTRCTLCATSLTTHAPAPPLDLLHWARFSLGWYLQPHPALPVPPAQVSLDVLSDGYRSEQKDYYLHTSQWTDTHPQQLLGPAAPIIKYDLNKLTLDELKVGRG